MHATRIDGIRMAQSDAADGAQAIRDLVDKLQQDDLELLVFFCSADYSRAAIESALLGMQLAAPVVGCTTAGEIGPLGYRQGSISGFSLSRQVCRAAVGGIEDVTSFDLQASRTLEAQLRDRVSGSARSEEATNIASILLVDGLSMREEVIARNLQFAMGNIAVIGGSAGDDLQLRSTWVYFNGAFRTGAAAVIMLAFAVPFEVFKIQHFTDVGERIVITDADPSRRIVREINGLPADEEYARLIGVTRTELSPALFAANPVVVVVDGTYLVRSIQKVNDDGSLTFYSAIEAGLVMQIAHGGCIVANLVEALSNTTAHLGSVKLLIAFDCILRRLEIERENARAGIEAAFRSCNTVGFSTYGEQFGGVHINQTLVGIALGSGKEDAP